MTRLIKSLATPSLTLVAMLAVGCSGFGDIEGPVSDNRSGPDAGSDPDPDPTDEPDADTTPADDGRVKNGIAALYKFNDPLGNLVKDTSGVLPALDLTIADPQAALWIPTGGLNITAPTIVQSALPAQKVFDACVASNEITFEAWVKPANLEQTGPARIFTNSIDAANRNFTLGQDTTSVNSRLRTTVTNNNGTPAILSNPDVLTGLTVQHLVYTRDAAWSKVYVDGVEVGTGTIGGKMENWDASYPLAIGNEVSLDRPWLGEIHLAAVYCRRLGTAEVQQNYAAGYSF